MKRVVIGTIMFASAIVASARAENSRASLFWQINEEKSPLTDEVTQKVASQVTFSDGNTLQAFANCRQTGIGAKPSYYPGLAIVFGTYQGTNLSPLPYAWEKKAIQLPVAVNDQRRPDVHGYTENLRANMIVIGFYDPTAAKRYARVDLPGIMRLEPLAGVANAAQTVAWDNFVAGTAGTLNDLLQATSARVQLPLSDGSADVAELNPQDPVLKDFAQRCNSDFRSAEQAREKKADDEKVAAKQAQLDRAHERRAAWNMQLDKMAVSDQTGTVLIIQNTQPLCLKQQQADKWTWERCSISYTPCSNYSVYNKKAESLQRSMTGALHNQIMEMQPLYSKPAPEGYIKVGGTGALPVAVKKDDLVPAEVATIKEFCSSPR